MIFKLFIFRCERGRDQSKKAQENNKFRRILQVAFVCKNY